ncbi:MAG TPA: outer membrane beta-barrel family protein, partial [Ignavibacteriales bacterium]|nr:outer membrane beta-barrel family protein [Ignavibacteriales bacterium]
NSKFQTDYLSWYPSATLSYKVWNNFPLSINFARRVRRPQLEMINPFVRRDSPFSTSVGNPEIGPTYIYVYELSLERMLKFYHTSAKGSPTQATISNPDGTSTTTTVNMDWGKSYGVETSLAYMSGDPRMPFTLPKWISMININAQYYKYESKGRYGVENLGSKSDNWNLNGSLNMSLWYDVSSNIYVYYRPKNNDKRNRNNAQLFLYMGFSKAFFDRKLQVRINLMDLLNTSKEWVNEEFADTYYSYNKWTSSIGRSVGISFTYSFNNYRPKQERNIGDDRDAGGSGMPGGQGGM